MQSCYSKSETVASFDGDVTELCCPQPSLLVNDKVEIVGVRFEDDNHTEDERGFNRTVRSLELVRLFFTPCHPVARCMSPQNRRHVRSTALNGYLLALYSGPKGNGKVGTARRQ